MSGGGLKINGVWASSDVINSSADTRQKYIFKRSALFVLTPVKPVQSLIMSLNDCYDEW